MDFWMGYDPIQTFTKIPEAPREKIIRGSLPEYDTITNFHQSLWISTPFPEIIYWCTKLVPQNRADQLVLN